MPVALAISGFVNFVLAIAFGSIVLLKLRNRLGLFFAFFMLSGAVWSFGYGMWLLSTEGVDALWWVKVLTLGSLFIPVTYLHWVTIFLNVESQKKTVLFLSYVLSSVFLLTLLFNQLIVGLEEELLFPFWPQGGLLYGLYILLVYLGNAGYGIKLLAESARHQKGTQQHQIQLVFFASFAGFLGGFTNFPLWYDIEVIPFGNFFVPLFFVIFSYAIMRYRLFGLIYFIRRASVTTAVIMILSLFYFLVNLVVSVWLSDALDPTIAVVVAISLSVIFYPFIYPQVKRLISKLIFPSYYTIEQRELHLRQLLRHSTHLPKICTELHSWLMTKYAATQVEMYFYNKTTKNFHSLNDELPIFNISDEPVRWMAENGQTTPVIDLRCVEEEMFHYFSQRNLTIIMPLVDSKEGLLGWIAFGSDAIQSDDIEQLAAQTSAIVQKFRFILDYESAITGAKKDGLLPKYL
jgi:hypothetical protein